MHMVSASWPYRRSRLCPATQRAHMPRLFSALTLVLAAAIAAATATTCLSLAVAQANTPGPQKPADASGPPPRRSGGVVVGRDEGAGGQAREPRNADRRA